MLSICGQPKSVNEMPFGLRWFVFISGLAETMLWSGTVFGWASIVHILKTHGVYSHLCRTLSLRDGNGTLSSEIMINGTGPMDANITKFGNQEPMGSLPKDNLEETDSLYNTELIGCVAQDEQFALICTVAMVLYSTPGILIGYALHHIGLAFTRIVASALLFLGFLLLATTTKETPHYLWGASIFLSMGGNTIRMAGLEFGNLFPERRNIAMSIISGMYTISAALFSLIQSASEVGYRWDFICQCLAAASLLIIMFTPFMPRHHIPYAYSAVATKDNSEAGEKSAADEDASYGQPLSTSVFSWSALFHLLWLFNNLFAITIFGTYFNSWINRFSKNVEEAAHYSRLYGFASLFCVFITPIPGLAIDIISGKLKKGTSGLAEKVACVQATIIPMTVISITVLIQITCFFFFTSYAVYLGLICLIINRPSCFGIGMPYVRARFPADHFNRLIGIQGTIISVLTMLQYPHFTWTQSQYFVAIGVLLAFLSLSLLNPLHLKSKRYLQRVLNTITSSYSV